MYGVAAAGVSVADRHSSGPCREWRCACWARSACSAAGAAVKIAAGGLRLLSKLKGVLRKIEEIVEKAREQMANVARRAVCPLVGGCFVAGTLVAMGDGELLEIQDVDVGAVVASAVPAACPSLQTADCDQEVSATWLRRYVGALHTVVLEGAGGRSAEVSGTPEHPFWVASTGSWRPMSELAVGSILDGVHGPVRVVSHRVSFIDVDVFNLTVGVTSSYRVSELGVLVHNVKKYKRNHELAKGHRARIHSSTPGEGGYHMHVYDKSGKEVARVNGNGGYSKAHGGKPLQKPSQLPSEVRNQINRIVESNKR